MMKRLFISLFIISYLIIDNKVSASIQDTSQLCMISILMELKKNGFPGVP